MFYFIRVEFIHIIIEKYMEIENICNIWIFQAAEYMFKLVLLMNPFVYIYYG